MIPMPQDEEASTQNSIGDTGGGLESEEPKKLADSWVCHQVMSARMLRLGVKQMNGDERRLNEAAK
jgi:hypothetical protein